VSAVSVEVVNLTRLAVDPEVVARLVAGVLESEGVRSGELGVRFVGAARMRALNRDYLGHDESPTCWPSRSKTPTTTTTAAAPTTSVPT